MEMKETQLTPGTERHVNRKKTGDELRVRGTRWKYPPPCDSRRHRDPGVRLPVACAPPFGTKGQGWQKAKATLNLTKPSHDTQG